MKAVCAQHTVPDKKDFVTLNTKWSIFSIFDGHRTSKAAEIASSNFMDTFRSTFSKVLSVRLLNQQHASQDDDATDPGYHTTGDLQLVDPEDVENILQQTFDSLDKTIERQGCHNSGTLVMCAVVLKNHVVFCWLGDGRAFVVDAEQNWTELDITPHTTEDADEILHVSHNRGYMTEKDNTLYVGGVLRYTRALGDADIPGLSKHIETLIVPRDKIHKLCLASKTLALPVDELQRLRMATKKSKSFCDEVVRKQKDMHPYQDCSIIVVSFDD